VSTINFPDVTPLWVICTIPRLVTIHYKQRSIHTYILRMCVCAQHPHQTTRVYLFNGWSVVHVRSKAEQNVFAAPPQCYFTFFTIHYPERLQIFFSKIELRASLKTINYIVLIQVVFWGFVALACCVSSDVWKHVLQSTENGGSSVAEIWEQRKHDRLCRNPEEIIT
jgi:hypothetical protein